MLTRLEVDGFKNLVGFSIDFGPYTCIAGPNGVGKSNVFDAIRFLSLLADKTLMNAAMSVRGGDSEIGDVKDLFWTNGEARIDKFTIAAEMIVKPKVEDDFGRPTEANSSFLRYQIEIGYEEPTHRGTLGRLTLLSESLNYIPEGEAARKLKFPHSPSSFRKAVVTNKRRARAGYISVRKSVEGYTEIVVHQDGGSRGPGQASSAKSAPATIVGISNTSITPTILAARREMQQWRFLALEPSAMRSPDRFQTTSSITVSGGHVPATLNRLAAEIESRGGDMDEVYGDVALRIAELVPVVDLEVDVDEARQLLTLVVEEQSGIKLPASSLSDGTLRFLTLAVLAADPQVQGLICIEEPENGIHPGKMREMVKLLQSLAVDAGEAPGLYNPFRQVIVATHSPLFVQLQNREDVLFATETFVSRGKQAVRTLRCKPMNGTWREKYTNESPVGVAKYQAYLTSPLDNRVGLFDYPYELLDK